MEKEGQEASRNRKIIEVLKIVVFILVVIIIALIIAFAVHSSQLKAKLESAPGQCEESSSNINLEEPGVLSPFSDLTAEEIRNVKNFLYSREDLNLVRPSEIRVNASYIFTLELRIPKKQATLEHLDNGRAAPEREARVWIFRGDLPEPFIEECTVGPLPNPVRKYEETSIPFGYRPLSVPETNAALAFVRTELHQKVSHILEESYGGKVKNCGDACLDVQNTAPFATASSGKPKARKLWFWLAPVVEFFSLAPLDFYILVDLTGSDITKYAIEKIFYGNEMFTSLEELARRYGDGSVAKTKQPFPDTSRESYTSMNRRGRKFPEVLRGPPREYEPNGKRYSINGRHIEYMGWEFDVRMSTTFGPQVFDIKYDGTRIVYELSVQEIVALYSGNNPGLRFSDFMDSVALLGTQARSLIPGADCPTHSTFLTSKHVIETQDDPFVLDRSFCVFEHNTGQPLRRHLTKSGPRKVYEGMLDIVLTVRTIVAIVNYDYLFDFVFHQNGVMEVRSLSSGYIHTSVRFPPEDSYGFILRDNIIGNLHHHFFSFKVDMDINGRNNRFEVLELNKTVSNNSLWSAEPNAKYYQTKMTRRQILRESEAAIKFNFDSPKYFTFYNKDHKTTAGVPKAYRLLLKGTTKQLFEEGYGQESSAAWARYQLAVTKYKDEEPRSSSIYAIWDGLNPVVDFQKFIDDDEVLTDQDQVAWVTLGMNHIPRIEDMPVVTTAGLDLRLVLFPFNYFEEDPAMGSSDAIRLEPNNQNNLTEGLTVQRYGNPENFQCVPPKTDFDNSVKDKATSVFTGSGDK